MDAVDTIEQSVDGRQLVFAPRAQHGRQPIGQQALEQRAAIAAIDALDGRDELAKLPLELVFDIFDQLALRVEASPGIPGVFGDGLISTIEILV